jgi:phosphoribosylamine--glycine ligase
VRGESVDLTVVGPEAPLAAGIVDRFDAEGLAILGPSRLAARLETSKAFAKDFMTRHQVPTAAFSVCRTPDEARAACDRLGYPVVVKADGLAAGKGVTVAPDRVTALAAVTRMMVDRQFGDAGGRLVIEECLHGPELSVFVLADGRRFRVLGAAHDHKRALDNDAGPNTGGMGAYSPSPLFGAALEKVVSRTIIGPVMAGMASDGHPYRGFLYAGLMLTAQGPKVIEFNVRFGDPEAQVVLPLVEGNLAAALAAAARGALDEAPPLARGARAHVGVVLASGGYPDAYEVGKPIGGLAAARAMPGVLLFHAGTDGEGDRLVTSGGRVLTVVASGASFSEARTRAYAAAEAIEFDRRHFRTDIARGVAEPGP